jgi:D-3-phosphoglycerate dehydrogenase
MNTPAGNTVATAELTFTHMLCGTRPIAQAAVTMRQGNWDRKHFSGSEMNGKTLAILGLGRIGAEVAKRAKAFGMRVTAYDPYLTAARAKALDIEMFDLESILPQADYITVHMPLTDATHYMVDEKAFARMKDGVRIFNCARGGIIKEEALLAALQSGKVAAAGLDVFENEPLAKDHPILTPHLGASTVEAQESVGLEVAEIICGLLRDGVVQNAVNMPSVDARTLNILRPYLTLGEKLGSILQQLTPDQVNKLVITYFGKIVDLDAMPLSRAIQRGYLLKISGSEVTDVNAPLVFKQLGIEVEVVKSSVPADYTELVQVEAQCSNGETHVIAGTLLGRAQYPRIVHYNTHTFEVSPQGYLLILENRDVPGIVGFLGTLLGKDNVNIANLSLSRLKGAETALAVYELDSAPSESAMKELSDHPAIKAARLVVV